MIKLKNILLEQRTPKSVRSRYAKQSTGLDASKVKKFKNYLLEVGPGFIEQEYAAAGYPGGKGYKTWWTNLPEIDPSFRYLYSQYKVQWNTDNQTDHGNGGGNPNQGDITTSAESEWLSWVLAAAAGVGVIVLSWVVRRKVINTEMWKSYVRARGQRGVMDIHMYLNEVASRDQQYLIVSKNGAQRTLTPQETQQLRKLLKNPQVRIAVMQDVSRWGLDQLRKGKISAQDLIKALRADTQTAAEIMRIEREVAAARRGNFSPNVRRANTKTNTTGNVGRMTSADLAQRVYQKSKVKFTAQQFERAAERSGQFTTADITNLRVAIADRTISSLTAPPAAPIFIAYNRIVKPSGISINMPTSILNSRTFPSFSTWSKAYNDAGMKLPSNPGDATMKYEEDRLKYNILRGPGEIIP